MDHPRLWRLWPEALVGVGALVVAYGAIGLHTEGAAGAFGLFSFHYSETDGSVMIAGAVVGAVGVCARSFRRPDENRLTR